MSGMKNSLVTPSEAADKMKSVAITREEAWRLKFQMQQDIAARIMQFYKESGGLRIYKIEVNFRDETWVGPNLPAGSFRTVVNVSTEAKL